MADKKRRNAPRQNRPEWKKVRSTKRVACKDKHGTLVITKDRYGRNVIQSNVKKIKTEEYVRA